MRSQEDIKRCRLNYIWKQKPIIECIMSHVKDEHIKKVAPLLEATIGLAYSEGELACIQHVNDDFIKTKK